MTLDATQNHDAPLTKERLFAWHGALFPTGRSGLSRIKVAEWRDDAHGPMQVVSGRIGRERVHYQAPAATVLPREMGAFLAWAETQDERSDPVVKAALAHLWFVTIHPFDDGNGRIARAIAELMLARADQSVLRFYSMSAQIRLDRNRYYDLLETTQKGSMDVSEWLRWFLQCLGRSFDRAERAMDAVIDKARFWDAARDKPLNARQAKVINRLLDGFEGRLTSSKYAAIAKCSQDTGAHDIAELVELGLLERGPGGGRSTHYELTWLRPSRRLTPAA
jgi:Fic family protein